MPNQSLRLLILAGTSMLLMAACATRLPAPHSKQRTFHDYLDGWHASGSALALASQGDRDALNTFFLAGYVRISEPYMGGEDLELMADYYGKLLITLGDDRFAHAPSLQRPEVRSAARWFVQTPHLRASFPKTFRILSRAPQIEFPMERVYRMSGERVNEQAGVHYSSEFPI